MHCISANKPDNEPHKDSNGSNDLTSLGYIQPYCVLNILKLNTPRSYKAETDG